MSTTFGIPRRTVDVRKLCDDEGELLDYVDTSFFEKVFYRSMNNSRWLNSIAHLLPDDTMVWPLDNSAQGIYNIGQIKKFLQTKHEQ